MYSQIMLIQNKKNISNKTAQFYHDHINCAWLI